MLSKKKTCSNSCRYPVYRNMNEIGVSVGWKFLTKRWSPLERCIMNGNACPMRSSRAPPEYIEDIEAVEQ